MDDERILEFPELARPVSPMRSTVGRAAVLVVLLWLTAAGGTAPAWAAAAASLQAVGAAPAAPPDTFPHPRHKKLACLTCHLSKTGALLTFEPPRGCQICHHQAPTRSDCAQCHEPASIPDGVTVQVAIAAAGRPARTRPIAFAHQRHADLRYTDCHGRPVTLAPVDSAGTCRGCHDQHHEAGRDCAVCHRTATIAEAHSRPVHPHVACDACHATAAIAALSPTRSFCLACHDPAVDHNAGKECSTCHLQADPEQYRARLLKRGTAG